MDERALRVQRFFEWPVLIAALAVLPVIVIEESGAGNTVKDAAAAANWAIWVVFAAEVVVMLVVVPDRWRWLRQHPLEVLIVVLTPPFLPSSLQAMRALRVLRLLRLLRVAQVARRIFSLAGVKYAGFLAFVAAFGGGAAFAELERDQGISTWDGVWWALTTMTTVGYGDLYPKTDGGRALAVAVMVVGIGVVALITASIAERFLAHGGGLPAEPSGPGLEVGLDRLHTELTVIQAQLQALEQRLGQTHGK
jgi:voltage-gated potassium channel